MAIIEYLESLFWTPPPMPANRLSRVVRFAGVEHLLVEVSEYFYSRGFLDGWIAATAIYALFFTMAMVLYLLISRRNDASPR